MKELKAIIDASDVVNRAMKGLSPDFGSFCNERAETLIIKVLENVFDDKADWISYYIYDLDWGKKWKKGTITDKGEEVKLKTLTDL